MRGNGPPYKKAVSWRKDKMKKNVEKKIRKGGLVKLNALGVARANRLVEYSNETPAVWGH